MKNNFTLTTVNTTNVLKITLRSTANFNQKRGPTLLDEFFVLIYDWSIADRRGYVLLNRNYSSLLKMKVVVLGSVLVAPLIVL